MICVGPISEAERVLDSELVCGDGLKYHEKNNTQGGDKQRETIIGVRARSDLGVGRGGDLLARKITPWPNV